MLASIVDSVFRNARDQARRAALLRQCGDRYERVTFAELAARIDHHAGQLARFGIAPGMRTILMVRPGLDFFSLAFALMKMGAVPVLIDPGMGKGNMVRCLASVQAEAFVGIPLAHLLRTLFPASFRSVRIAVTLGRRYLWGGSKLETALKAEGRKPKAENRKPEAPNSDIGNRHSEIAAILFTTGSTGPPKGVVYHPATFAAQVAALRDHFGLAPGQIDLATFPLFALFDAALGVTAVIPDMDPTRPGFVDPRRILNTLDAAGCTNMFASPALLDRVGRFGAAQGARLPMLRRVITAGAPVRPDILATFDKLLPADATVFTGYGATEALPVAAISHREILAETADVTARGHGVCVGRPVGDVRVRIIPISDDAVPGGNVIFQSRDRMGAGGATHHQPSAFDSTSEIGEIAVAGPVVTREYFNNAAATALAKIRDGDTLWHRMGDVGYLDNHGRLWMCGRKAHRVEAERGTLFTECVEALFNQHPAVRRSALVGLGERPRERPVICVELHSRVDGRSRERLCEELRAIARAHDMTRDVETFLFHPRFPVDIRHNAKIFREQLREWAARRMGTG